MRGLALALALLPGAAAAQKLDCGNPATPQDMAECAFQDFETADSALTDIYSLAIDATRALDSRDGRTSEDSLRAAQEAWITFRYLACEVEGLLADGGSREPMLVDACLARVTWARVEDLRLLTGG